MSISNRGRSTIWDAKTRTTCKSKRKVQPSLTRLINQGYEYFWSRRRVGQFHNGNGSST
jgi:hypothetical protein